MHGVIIGVDTLEKILKSRLNYKIPRTWNLSLRIRIRGYAVNYRPPLPLSFLAFNEWIRSESTLAQCAAPTRVATSTSFLVLRRVLSSSNASKT